MERRKHETDSITSTADAGGNDENLVFHLDILSPLQNKKLGKTYKFSPQWWAQM